MRVVVTLVSSSPLSSFFKSRIQKAVAQTFKMVPSSVTRKLSKRHSRPTISVALVDTKTMTKLNRTFRQKNKPTDVLSFSRLEHFAPVSNHEEIGDLIICLPIARRQAREFKEPVVRELERLAVHGTLHLLGYDHEKSKKDEIVMFQLQDKVLKQLSPHHLKT